MVEFDGKNNARPVTMRTQAGANRDHRVQTPIPRTELAGTASASAAKMVDSGGGNASDSAGLTFLSNNTPSGRVRERNNDLHSTGRAPNSAQRRQQRQRWRRRLCQGALCRERI